jgi:hypothetical protein
MLLNRDKNVLGDSANQETRFPLKTTSDGKPSVNFIAKQDDPFVVIAVDVAVSVIKAKATRILH